MPLQDTVCANNASGRTRGYPNQFERLYTRFVGIIKRREIKKTSKPTWVLSLFTMVIPCSFSSQETTMIEPVKGQAVHCGNREIQSTMDDSRNSSLINKSTENEKCVKPGFIESSLEHISRQSGCNAGRMNSENGRQTHDLMFCSN